MTTRRGQAPPAINVSTRQNYTAPRSNSGRNDKENEENDEGLYDDDVDESDDGDVRPRTKQTSKKPQDNKGKKKDEGLRKHFPSVRTTRVDAASPAVNRRTGSNHFDEEDDEETDDDDEDEDEDDEGPVRHSKSRESDSIRRDVPIRPAAPVAKRGEGTTRPPQHASATSLHLQSQSTSDSQSLSSESVRGRSPVVSGRESSSSSSRSTSSDHAREASFAASGASARELFGVTEPACRIDPDLKRRILEKLPCAFPYASGIWNKHVDKLRRDGLFRYALMDDDMKAIDLEEHFKVLYYFMFHLVVVDMSSTANPRNQALNKLTWEAEWKCFHPAINTAIQNSFVFKSSELFHRRIEYFKRHIQDKIIRAMPTPGDLVNRSRGRKAFKWLKAVDLIQLKVLCDAFISLLDLSVYLGRCE